MIEVNYNEYKETIAENMKLIIENHELKENINKAIEYINEYKESGMGEEWFKSSTPITNLLNILGAKIMENKLQFILDEDTTPLALVNFMICNLRFGYVIEIYERLNKILTEALDGKDNE